MHCRQLIWTGLQTFCRPDQMRRPCCIIVWEHLVNAEFPCISPQYVRKLCLDFNKSQISKNVMFQCELCPSQMQARHLCFIFTNVFGPVGHFLLEISCGLDIDANVHVIYLPHKMYQLLGTRRDHFCNAESQDLSNFYDYCNLSYQINFLRFSLATKKCNVSQYLLFIPNT